jgi:hypothetical protein
MIRYRYAELIPPAPMLNVTVRCPFRGIELIQLAALVDTAADRTILPEKVVARLGLVEIDRLDFLGFGSRLMQLPAFAIDLAVHDLPAVRLKAALGEDEPFILLGRDLLNTLRILLDGPAGALELQG